MELPKSQLRFWKMLKDDQNLDIEVWIEDGDYIRFYWDVKWVGAGHDLVDLWIPEFLKGKRKAKGGVIIVEICHSEIAKEEFVVGHELPERCVMAYGADYDSAHEFASVCESEYLKHKYGVPAPYIEQEQL
jgi:hypothetical protein